MVGYADCAPRSSVCQACCPPGRYSMNRSVFGSFVENAQAAVLAVELGAAFPVDRLRRVEVARVQKLRAHLEHTSVAPLANEAEDLLPAGIERELGRATDEQLGMRRDLGHDRLVRG